MKPESFIFVAIGIGLVWYVLEHQVSQADVLSTATTGQLVNQIGQNIANTPIGQGLLSGVNGAINATNIIPDT